MGTTNMASTKEYLDFILEQLSDLDEITYKAMMGEYIIYYRGKSVGGIYEDRFLVKNIRTAADMMPYLLSPYPIMLFLIVSKAYFSS